jgi:3-oxoacyl-[acyl-carrier protein] reductase
MNGAKVVVNDIEEQLIREAVESIKKEGREAFGFQCDVRDKDKVNEMVAASLNKFGCLDILVNNAGITRDALFHKMTDEQWKVCFDINVNGAYNCIKAVAAHMMSRGGNIINVSSVSALEGIIGSTNYSAAKSAIIGLTKALAREWAKYNVRVNCVAFGFVETRLTEERRGTEVLGQVVGIPKEIRDKYISRIPLGRFAKPEEAANAILFLASDESSYMTGAVLNVSGGYYM